MMSQENKHFFDHNLTDSLKNYAVEILDEYKKTIGPQINFKDLSWIIKTQINLNIYLKTFKLKFQPQKHNIDELKKLTNLQLNIINQSKNLFPKNSNLTKEILFPKLVKALSTHNKFLSEFWVE